MRFASNRYRNDSLSKEKSIHRHNLRNKNPQWSSSGGAYDGVTDRL